MYSIKVIAIINCILPSTSKVLLESQLPIVKKNSPVLTFPK